MQLSVSYFVYKLIIMVTVIRHIFINFFQTEHFSAVKFAMGYERSMSFLVIPKSLKLRKSDWAILRVL